MFKLNLVMIFNTLLAAVLAYFVLSALTKRKVDPATGQIKTSFAGFSGFDDVFNLNQ